LEGRGTQGAQKQMHTSKLSRNLETRITTILHQFQDKAVLTTVRARKFYLHENDHGIFMATRNCPMCGKAVAPNIAFCPFCGAKLDYPFQQVNTHSFGWVLMSFLVSFLWFKINNSAIFPLGFVGGLIITFWASDIDKALGKEPFTWLSVALCVLGMILGLFI
jgi:predicted nucleic acid-binding Zn ribbon protein